MGVFLFIIFSPHLHLSLWSVSCAAVEHLSLSSGNQESVDDIVSVCLNLCRRGFRLGLAYAGSNREDVLSLLLPVMGDSKSSMEVWMCVLCPTVFSLHKCSVKQRSDVCVFNMQVVGVTALACGMIAVGSCNGDVTSTIVQTIMEKNEQELKDSYARWLPLGLGLNHLGKH